MTNVHWRLHFPVLLVALLAIAAPAAAQETAAPDARACTRAPAPGEGRAAVSRARARARVSGQAVVSHLIEPARSA